MLIFPDCKQLPLPLCSDQWKETNDASKESFNQQLHIDVCGSSIKFSSKSDKQSISARKSMCLKHRTIVTKLIKYLISKPKVGTVH